MTKPQYRWWRADKKSPWEICEIQTNRGGAEIVRLMGISGWILMREFIGELGPIIEPPEDK